MENENLIIGNTSQLSYYFPDNYIKLSSRNIDFNFLKSKNWNSVYITFSDQRIHQENIDYITPNFHYTLKIIENLKDHANKIVIYGTSELWNNLTGKIDINQEFNYNYPNDYCKSKHLLINYIKDQRKQNNFNNVIILHPFYFNSSFRKKEFLFGKIFDSIINKNIIEIGNTYFHRDIVHAKYVANRSVSVTTDEIIGSGRLFFVNDYIRDLYKYFKMDYQYYIKENLEQIQKEKLYYSHQDIIYTYDRLLSDTIEDIENLLNKKQKIV